MAVERSSNTYDIDQAHISFATFNSANVCPMEIGSFRQGLL